LILAVSIGVLYGLWRAADRWLSSRSTPPVPEPHAPVTLLGAPLPSFAGVKGWLNGGPPTPDSASRVVVLLWSSTRPDGIAAAARARAWDDAFRRYGLRVIGVHLPEFAFAADPAAVSVEAERLGLRFPIALDPTLQVAQAFGVQAFRPRFLMTNGEGVVLHQVDGNGAELEGPLRAELARARPDVRFPNDAAPGESLFAPPPAMEWPPTLYLGTTRATKGPLAGATAGESRLFSSQFRNQVEGEPYTPIPQGLWRITADGLVAERGGAEQFIALRYDAGALGAVLSPPASGPARLWVLKDEAWLPSHDGGADLRVDGRGASYVLVDQPRLYQICGAVGGEHVVKLSPEDPGLAVHAFTFEPVDTPSR
jgi:hypothetical protein